MKKSLRGHKWHEAEESIARNYCRDGKDPPHLEKLWINESIGYGAFVTRCIRKGEFLCEYAGDLISDHDAELREINYAQEKVGNFIFYLHKKDQCIDATLSHQICKFINDSPRRYCNASMKQLTIDGKPHLCLFALHDIAKGQELRYDYNDKDIWWRKKKDTQKPFFKDDIFPVNISIEAAKKTNKTIKIIPASDKQTTFQNITIVFDSSKQRDQQVEEHLKYLVISSPDDKTCSNMEAVQEEENLECGSNLVEDSSDGECYVEVLPKLLKVQKEVVGVEKDILDDAVSDAVNCMLDIVCATLMMKPEEKKAICTVSDDTETIFSDIDLHFSSSDDERQRVDFNVEIIKPISQPNNRRLQTEEETKVSGLFPHFLGEEEKEVADVVSETINHVLKDVCGTENPTSLGINQRSDHCSQPLDYEDYIALEPAIENQLDDDVNDLDFKPDFSDDEFGTEVVADVKLEEAIKKITELCAGIQRENEEVEFLPVNEVSIINDTGIALGDSVGEVVDTDESDMDDGTVSEQNAETKEGFGNSNHTNDVRKGKKKRKSKKKIYRPCLFCVDGTLQSALTRHIKMKHKEEPAVKKANLLPRRERLKAFDNMRKEGIFKYNRKQMKNEKPTYMRERKGDVELVICTKCKGGYSKAYKARHQIQCGKTSGQVMIPAIAATSMVATDLDDDFKTVINKMILDEVSNMAKRDSIILIIGARIFNGQKCKTEKKQETEKRVRLSMRLLSRLYLKFRESFADAKNCFDMFDKRNLCHLRYSIDELCNGQDGLKCGLKIQIQNLIKQAAKILEAHYLVEGKNTDAEIVTDFMKVFALVEDELFNGALYQIKQKRNKSTRKPANLPTAEAVQLLTSYLKKVTDKKNITFELPQSIFVTVRDAVCARLTLYNGRRGGEPARLFLYQYKEAIDGVWLRPETRTQYREEINIGNRITFQEGKGDRQVPVFIPPDVISALDFLCDKDIREQCDVDPGNEYVFPSTHGSDNHVSGWHALMLCCKKANLPGHINGTLNRHRVSSLIGALGLQESEQQLAFDHFGHSGDVNKNIYQVPQAERQLASTGKYLQLIDSGLDNRTLPKKLNENLPKTSSPIQSCSKVRKRMLKPKVLGSGEEGDSEESENNDVRPEKKVLIRTALHSRVEGEAEESEDILPKKICTRNASQSTESSESKESEDDSVLTPTEYASFRWNPDLVKKFKKQFWCYVDKSVNKPMPSRQEMALFLKKNNQTANFSVVRNRINNERAKLKQRVKSRKKSLGL